MSIYTYDLREIANNHGWGVCESAADEIEDLEKAYELLFAENAKLRAQIAAAPEMLAALQDAIDTIEGMSGKDLSCDPPVDVSDLRAVVAKAVQS